MFCLIIFIEDWELKSRNDDAGNLQRLQRLKLITWDPRAKYIVEVSRMKIKNVCCFCYFSDVSHVIFESLGCLGCWRIQQELRRIKRSSIHKVGDVATSNSYIPYINMTSSCSYIICIQDYGTVKFFVVLHTVYWVGYLRRRYILYVADNGSNNIMLTK